MGRRTRRPSAQRTQPQFTKRRSESTKPPGARVARVAVDDATWAAFRELCGPTPASVRLGQLVDAEVRRTRDPTTQEAGAEIEAIRDRLNQLERLILNTD